MNITHKLALDLQHPTCEKFYVKQGDVLTRSVALALYDGGTVFDVPQNSILQIVFLKPDRTGGIYDTLPDGSVACTVSDNIVTAKLHPQMFTASGCVSCELRMINLNGAKLLSTFGWKIIVEPSAESGIKSESYYRFASIASISAAIGDLAQLNTKDDTSIVAAINEVLSLVGGLKNAIEDIGGGIRGFYIQPDEPVDAPDGSIWLDTDDDEEESPGSPQDGVSRFEMETYVSEAVKKAIGDVPPGASGWKHAGALTSETDGEVLTISDFSAKTVRIVTNASCTGASASGQIIKLNGLVSIMESTALQANGSNRIRIYEFKLMSDGTNHYLYSSVVGTPSHNSFKDSGAMSSIYTGTTSGVFMQKVPIEQIESISFICSNGVLSAGSSISVDYI